MRESIYQAHMDYRFCRGSDCREFPGRRSNEISYTAGAGPKCLSGLPGFSSARFVSAKPIYLYGSLSEMFLQKMTVAKGHV